LPIALRGGLALRADLSVLFHDFETWSSFPDITTKSYITSLRAGPQVALSAGRVQLYGFGAGGFSYFATDAEFGSSCDCSFTTTLRDDWTWVTEIGGGMRELRPRCVRGHPLPTGEFSQPGPIVGGMRDLKCTRLEASPVSMLTAVFFLPRALITWNI